MGVYDALKGLVLLVQFGVYLFVLGLVGLCLAVTRRVWTGIVPIAASVAFAGAFYLDSAGGLVGLIMPGLLLMLIFRARGREPGTSLLTRRARTAAAVISALTMPWLIIIFLLAP